jgi:hypothetical protein
MIVFIGLAQVRWSWGTARLAHGFARWNSLHVVSSPTVLVVGAGGSIPYRYPSGSELVRFVADPAENSAEATTFRQLLLELGFRENVLHMFRQELFLSRRYSIDAFLEKRSEFQ